MNRPTLDCVVAMASKVVSRGDLPEIVPGEERGYDERGFLGDMLAYYSENIVADDPIGKLESTDAGLAYLALRTGDLHLMRAALAYSIRQRTLVEAGSEDRADARATKGAA